MPIRLSIPPACICFLVGGPLFSGCSEDAAVGKSPVSTAEPSGGGAAPMVPGSVPMPEPAGGSGLGGAPPTLGTGGGGASSAGGPSGGGQASTGGALPSGGAGGSPSMGSGGTDASGEADPLLGGLTEAEAKEKYYFRQEGNQVVIEAEHFVSQRYCDSEVYRGKRWWMVQRTDRAVKGTPEFTVRCEEAQQELRDIGKAVDGEKNIAQICGAGREAQESHWDDAQSTNGESANGLSATQIFEMFGCDGDESHAGEASGGAYVELLPDVLYNNYNAVPHSLSNWDANPYQAPKAYYRVNFSQAGDYTISARVFRSDSDSGDMWVATAKAPGMEPNGTNNGWGKLSGSTGNWVWKSAGGHRVEAGEYYVVIAGREDGFEADKIVVSQGGCQGCNGMGPDESPTMQE